MKNQVVAPALAALNLFPAGLPAYPAEVTRMHFGELKDGTSIEAIVLSNSHGTSATIITLGATIQSLSVPDRNGRSEDILLGYRTAEEYLENPQYFGATVGRYANRIAGGRFTLDGKHYTLPTNDGPNHLHGGPQGLDKALWKVESVSKGSPATVTFSHTSPAGEGGYPGTLDINATYALNDQDELSIEYRATSDEPTIVNITNHAYFNLAGEAGRSDVMEHRLTLNADRYTPVDETLIPTGELREVAGTAFDFREGGRIGLRIRDGSDEQIRFGRGYDHNFVVNGTAGTLRSAARVEDPHSGRVMEVMVTAPGVQFYSGNLFDGTTVGKTGRVYRQGDAFCLEPQVFPDSPNKRQFPSARLDPGDTYVNRMVFRFSATGR